MYQVTSCSQSLGTQELCTWGCTWIKKHTISAEGQRRQKSASPSKCCPSWMAAQGALARDPCRISCVASAKAIRQGQRDCATVANGLKAMVRQKAQMTSHVQKLALLGNIKSRGRIWCHLPDSSLLGRESAISFHVSVEIAICLCLLGTRATAV